LSDDNGTSHFAGTTESGEKDEFSDDCQKTRRDCADVTWRGSSFQTLESATEKLGR